MAKKAAGLKPGDDSVLLVFKVAPAIKRRNILEMMPCGNEDRIRLPPGSVRKRSLYQSLIAFLEVLFRAAFITTLP